MVRRGAGLGAVATCLTLGLLAIGGFACATAGAAEFVYRINGAELAEGQTREWLRSADGVAYKFVRTTGAPSVSFECKGMVFQEAGTLYGGYPGTLTVKPEWKECSGSVGGATCKGIVAKSWTKLSGEIVEFLAGEKKGGPGLLIYPETGEELVRFESTCGGSPDVRIFKGSVVAEPSSNCGNFAEVDILFPGQVGKVGTTEGVETVATTIEGSPARIEGSTTTHLFNSPKWGIC